MRLGHNIASLEMYTVQNRVLEQQTTALQRITSGLKVSTAKDDPNVIAQSERMNMQIRGLQMAGRNTQDGVSMLQTAEGGLDGMTQMVQRIRELVVQSGNGTNSDDDKKTIQSEIDQMIKGIDNISQNTDFNGNKLLSQGNDYNNSDVKYLEMATGPNAGENVKIPCYNLASSNLKASGQKSLADIDVTQGGTSTDESLNIVDNALNIVVSVRSEYGSLENRFQNSYDDINAISTTTVAADSSLTDADMAGEMAEYAKDNVLLQAETAMMVQSNKLPQDALQILENVKSR